MDTMPVSVDAVMQSLSDACNEKSGGDTINAPVRDVRLLLAEIMHLRGALKEFRQDACWPGQVAA